MQFALCATFWKTDNFLILLISLKVFKNSRIKENVVEILIQKISMHGLSKDHYRKVYVIASTDVTVFYTFNDF